MGGWEETRGFEPGRGLVGEKTRLFLSNFGVSRSSIMTDLTFRDHSSHYFALLDRDLRRELVIAYQMPPRPGPQLTWQQLSEAFSSNLLPEVPGCLIHESQLSRCQLIPLIVYLPQQTCCFAYRS